MTDTEKKICDMAFENWWSGLKQPHSGRIQTYRYVDDDTLADKWQAKAVWRACWETTEQIRAKAKLHAAVDAADFSDIL